MPRAKSAPKKKATKAPPRRGATATRPAALTARDVMTKDPVTVRTNHKLSDAMSLMVANHVTGLPVVDRAGHCVGVITIGDILGYEQEHAEGPPEDVEVETTPFFDQEKQQWEDVAVTAYALEHFGEVPVNEVMTADVVSVAADATIRSVAERMIDAEVHRVIVLDAKQYLLGSISAIDLVRLVASGDL